MAGSEFDLTPNNELQADQNENLRSQLVNIVSGNHARLVSVHNELLAELGSSQTTVQLIDRLVAEVTANSNNAEDLEGRISELAQKYQSTYEEAENTKERIMGELVLIEPEDEKHQELLGIISRSDLLGVPVEEGDFDLLPASGLMNTQEEEVIDANGLEGHVLFNTLVSERKLQIKLTELDERRWEVSEQLEIMETRSAEILAQKSRQDWTKWVLFHPAEAAKLLREDGQITKSIVEFRLSISQLESERAELASDFGHYAGLKSEIIAFTDKYGSIKIIRVRDASGQETSEAKEQEPQTQQEALLNILVTSIPEGQGSEIKLDTQEAAVVSRRRTEHGFWANIFGPELQRKLGRDGYNAFVQNYRNALATLVLSPNLDNDPEIVSFRQIGGVYLYSEGKLKVDYKMALGFIDSIATVKQVREAYRDPEPVARIVSLVYWHKTGIFVDHTNFIELAKEIVINKDVHGENIYIRETVEVMLQKEEKNSIQEPQENSVSTSSILDLARQAGQVIEETTPEVVELIDKQDKRREIARRLVNAAIQDFQKIIDIRNISIAFPFAPDQTISVEQLNYLFTGGAANERHLAHDNGWISRDERLSIYDIFVIYIAKTNINLFRNKREMKKLMPLVVKEYVAEYTALTKQVEPKK